MIVVLGASGYVGQSIYQRLLAEGLTCSSISRRDVDIYNVERLTAALAERKCQFLINAAGYTGRPNVDACEIHRTECLLANAVLPGRIRQACERRKIPWSHVSSGCIFSGAHADGSGFREDDAPNFSFRSNNCSFYSGTKALGEELLSDAENCYIWRLRIPFNEVDGPRNYLSKLLRYTRLLEARNSLSHLDDFAAACVQSWTDRIPFGIYNITNTGSVTTREVCEMLRATIVPGRSFEFFANEAEFMTTAAKTPRSNCVLDNSKALRAGLRLPHVRDAIERSLARWTPEESSVTSAICI